MNTAISEKWPGAAEDVAPKGHIARLLSRPATAEHLGVCVRTVDQMRRDGQIRAVMVRGRVLYDPVEINRYVEAQQGSVVVATNGGGK